MRWFDQTWLHVLLLPILDLELIKLRLHKSCVPNFKISASRAISQINNIVELYLHPCRVWNLSRLRVNLIFATYWLTCEVFKCARNFKTRNTNFRILNYNLETNLVKFVHILDNFLIFQSIWIGISSNSSRNILRSEYFFLIWTKFCYYTPFRFTV